jgi:hypothetical protein
MNIFDALNIFYREDTVSDFLINCFKDSQKFLIRFLNEANISVREDTDFCIDTRVGLGEKIGTPDIIIRALRNCGMKFIIVENKIRKLTVYFLRAGGQAPRLFLCNMKYNTI